MSTGSSNDRSQGKRSSRLRDGGGGRGGERRPRSRSPRGFTGRDWHMDGISNDTQRHEEHMKRARLFVGNIDVKSVTRADLSTIFEKHGGVVAVSVHPGYSFVQMDSERSANRAINYEHGATINGCKINVEFSTAAVKAGARFRQLPPLRQSSPPPSHRDPLGGPRSSDYPSVPSSSSYLPHYPDSDLVDRERRLQRILALERELKQERSALYPLGGGGGNDDYYTTSSSSERGTTGRGPVNPFMTDPYGRSRSPRKDYMRGPSGVGSGGVGTSLSTGATSKRSRSLSPSRPLRAGQTTDPFSSRLPSERYAANFGSRYSGGGGYSDFGRGNASTTWQ